ncbi:Rhamnolipids biosynthesis 3-oxoacyl-[acyl-carrier-protein] reductase [Lachnellula occidentalis]|uniref:Rhamnolipids biosynthesis 3-oxoacyl-[acyl-carrier-protein] reductase n=1 Tax=Lachnellula occidentalis TaxID=215460 RepID=A0A8H8RZK8_9HELO|nr:Rhamnolipids biosynthesis 3-oxoacyl-[acyl-carrier-protein] reductase [Lachnellula occidentalis]
MASTEVNNLFSVKGRVALVTGGTSGIGLMIAKGLVTNGAKVYVCGLESDPIKEVEATLNDHGKASGGTAVGFPCDLTLKHGIEAISVFLRTQESHLDILISNAGIRRDPPQSCDVLTAPLAELQASLWSSSYSDWTQSFQINTMAHYFLSVALIDLLAAAGDAIMADGTKGKDHGRGVVVVTSSIASLHNATNVDMMSYATTKAATDHLVALLASKFARWYFQVVPSNMNPMGTGAGADIFGDLVQKVPAKRAGSMDDLAGVVLFLVSKAGAYVDGRSIAIDGGRTLFANGQI